MTHVPLSAQNSAVDPGTTATAGQRLTWQSRLFRHADYSSSGWIDEQGRYQGAVLTVTFGSETGISIEGSAVMVAPGIAICAKHVFGDRLNDIQDQRMGVECYGVENSTLCIWEAQTLISIDHTDLALLTLRLSSEMADNDCFNSACITTRLPAVGEYLSIVGFRANDNFFASSDANEVTASLALMVCSGRVTAHYMRGRDQVMLPWPTIEVDCPSWGGMSGGPAFDSSGRLVGLLCSSLASDDGEGPSYISMIWPALVHPFAGGWPISFMSNSRSLIKMQANMCDIDRREAVVGGSKLDELPSFMYRPWS